MQIIPRAKRHHRAGADFQTVGFQCRGPVIKGRCARSRKNDCRMLVVSYKMLYRNGLNPGAIKVGNSLALREQDFHSRLTDSAACRPSNDCFLQNSIFLKTVPTALKSMQASHHQLTQYRMAYRAEVLTVHPATRRNE